MNGRTKAVALTSVMLIALSLTAGGLSLVAAETDQDDATASNPPYYVGGWRMRGLMLGCLDEAQRQEVTETVEAMREEGASQDEIREYVQAYLEELGVECRMPQLTDEQMDGLRQLRAQVQELIQRRLGELGIDRSFMGRGLGSSGRGARFAKNQGS